MTVDEKYKKTLEEIEALKDHLGTTACLPLIHYCSHGNKHCLHDKSRQPWIDIC